MERAILHMNARHLAVSGESIQVSFFILVIPGCLLSELGVLWGPPFLSIHEHVFRSTQRFSYGL